MTHTLETTAIAARRRAGAAAERRPRRRRSGSATTWATRRSVTQARRRSTRPCTERFGRRFRHNEQSLRIAESLNLTEEVRDGILTHTGLAGAGERSRARSSGSSTAWPTSTTTSTMPFASAILDAGELPLTEDRPARRPRLEAHRHARPRSRRERRSGRATSSRATRSAVPCSPCGRSCSSGSISGRTRSYEQDRARAAIRRIFDHVADRGDDPEQIVEFIAGMTDRFALELPLPS